MRTVLVLALAGVTMCACDESAGYQAGYEAQASQTVPGRRFTKAEFSNYAYNRSKAQIRGEFGSPSYVEDGSDTWVYMNLPVYDADAGTRSTMIKLQFTGAPPPDDFVANVTY